MKLSPLLDDVAWLQQILAGLVTRHDGGGSVLCPLLVTTFLTTSKLSMLSSTDSRWPLICNRKMSNNNAI